MRSLSISTVPRVPKKAVGILDIASRFGSGAQTLGTINVPGGGVCGHAGRSSRRAGRHEDRAGHRRYRVITNSGA